MTESCWSEALTVDCFFIDKINGWWWDRTSVFPVKFFPVRVALSGNPNANAHTRFASTPLGAGFVEEKRRAAVSRLPSRHIRMPATQRLWTLAWHPNIFLSTSIHELCSPNEYAYIAIFEWLQMHLVRLNFLSNKPHPCVFRRVPRCLSRTPLCDRYCTSFPCLGGPRITAKIVNTSTWPNTNKKGQVLSLHLAIDRV